MKILQKPIFFLILFVLDVAIWFNIFTKAEFREPEVHFLDVGQGDSELVILPGGVKILIDGGRGGRILDGLDDILRGERYIDLVVLSHPQLDHFGGFADVLGAYRIGVFISSGEIAKSKTFGFLRKILKEQRVETVELLEGDSLSYGDYAFNVISPPSLTSKDLNDNSLVLFSQIGHWKLLFTGDISSKAEDRLASEYDLDIDVLKVAHHGSKYSTGQKFLDEATPLISVIGVGRNSYGHPTPEVLEKLEGIGSQIYRTDRDGRVKIKLLDDRMRIF